MIETLTPPATGAAIHPGAKAAAAAAGGIDFAALFGTAGAGVADSAVPKGDAALPVFTGVPTSAIPTPATGIPPVDPPLAAPVTVTTDPTAGLATPAPVDPVTADPVALPTAPVTAGSDAIAESDAPAVPAPQLGLKPPAIRPHGPVTVDDDESVKLPTLPAGFIAQKAPKLPVATDDAASDEQDGETSDADPASATAPVPQPLICAVAPEQAAPPPAAVAATLISDAPNVRRGPTLPKDAAKTDLAMKGAEAVAVDAAAPVTPADAATPVAVPSAHLVISDNSAAAQPPVIAPLLPAGALAPQAAPAPAASVDTQQSVALDDLMVAGAGDSAWLDRVASDISTLAKGDAREAHMKINPRSLGDMSIRLDMDGARARVHFTVDTPQAQAMIADAAPKLTSLVQANGLKLDGATVDLNQHRRDGQPGQAQQQQQSDTPTPFNHTTSEAARLAGRTRLVTRTDRFA